MSSLVDSIALSILVSSPVHSCGRPSSHPYSPIYYLSPDVFQHLLKYLTPLNAILLCRCATFLYPRLWTEAIWRYYLKLRDPKHQSQTQNQNQQQQQSHGYSVYSLHVVEDLPLFSPSFPHSSVSLPSSAFPHSSRLYHSLPISYSQFRQLILQEASSAPEIEFALPMAHYPDSPDQFPSPYSSFSSSLRSALPSQHINYSPLSAAEIEFYSREFLRIIPESELNSLFSEWNVIINDQSMSPAQYRLCWLMCCCCFGIGCGYFVWKAERARKMVEHQVAAANSRFQDEQRRLNFAITPGPTLEGVLLIVKFRRRPELLPGYRD